MEENKKKDRANGNKYIVRIESPNAGDSRITESELTEIITRIDKAVKRILGSVLGEKSAREKSRKKIEVESVIVGREYKKLVATLLVGESSFPFWKSTSTAKLAKIQGVAPVTDLGELSTLWPGDEDPKDLLKFVLEDRRKRRKAEGL